jgi:putative transposase
MTGYRKPEDLIGENGLLKQFTKLLVEKALEAEMTLPQMMAVWST